MDRLKHSQMEDERTVMTRMMKGAMAGLMPGIIWGVFAANAANMQPTAGRAAASPKVIPTLKIIGKKGLIGAGTGVLWFGVKLLVEKYRVKRDFLNDVAGGFVAGATLASLRWRRIPVAIFAGATLASVTVVLDAARIYRLKVEKQSGEQRNQHLKKRPDVNQF